MKYEHIARYVGETLWAIQPSKMMELLNVLAYRAAGHEFTPEEIAARIGPSPAEIAARLEDGAHLRALRDPLVRAGTQANMAASGAIQVIPISGVIAHRMGGMDESSGGTSAERIGKTLDRIAADPQIGTIVYDINSPGGTVPGIQELAAQMWALRGEKKQIAQVNSLAASAAYWLASQCDEIVSLPSGTAGSIGVFSVHEDLSAALEKEGIKVTLISAGKYKVAGNPFEPLSDEERAVIQARVDVAYAQFTKDVARGRGVSAADVRSGYGEERALAAKDALTAGLIDRIATMDETIGRLMGRKAGANGMRAELEGDELAAAAATDELQAATDRARRRRLL